VDLVTRVLIPRSDQPFLYSFFFPPRPSSVATSDVKVITERSSLFGSDSPVYQFQPTGAPAMRRFYDFLLAFPSPLFSSQETGRNGTSCTRNDPTLPRLLIFEPNIPNRLEVLVAHSNIDKFFTQSPLLPDSLSFRRAQQSLSGDSSFQAHPDASPFLGEANSLPGDSWSPGRSPRLSFL